MARLVAVTPKAEDLIAYCARVSNPANQDSPPGKLLKYCIDNQHWSIFEMANMVIEIETSRAISSQLLRHRSFSFQEFSQRYAEVAHSRVYPPRRQDEKNRQNSIDDLDLETKTWFYDKQIQIDQLTRSAYRIALKKGIAKESARFLLPMSSKTVVYMNGTIRSWIHYLQLRLGNGTQKEHRDIAEDIQKIFIKNFPVISEALGWVIE